MNRNPSPLRTSVELLFLFLLLFASPAHAQDDEEDEDQSYGRPGWYLVADVIGAFTFYRDREGTVDDSVGFDARVGYRVNPNAAIEAEFEWISGFDETLNGVKTFGFRSYAVGINGKYFLMDGVIQPYAVGGVNALIVTESIVGNKTRETDWGFRGGLGADYYLTPNIALNTELTYMWGVGDVWQKDYLSLGAGLMYRF